MPEKTPIVYLNFFFDFYVVESLIRVVGGRIACVAYVYPYVLYASPQRVSAGTRHACYNGMGYQGVRRRAPSTSCKLFISPSRVRSAQIRVYFGTAAGEYSKQMRVRGIACGGGGGVDVAPHTRGTSCVAASHCGGPAAAASHYVTPRRRWPVTKNGPIRRLDSPRSPPDRLLPSSGPSSRARPRAIEKKTAMGCHQTRATDLRLPRTIYVVSDQHGFLPGSSQRTCARARCNRIRKIIL